MTMKTMNLKHLQQAALITLAKLPPRDKARALKVAASIMTGDQLRCWQKDMDEMLEELSSDRMVNNCRN